MLEAKKKTINKKQKQKKRKAAIKKKKNSESDRDQEKQTKKTAVSIFGEVLFNSQVIERNSLVIAQTRISTQSPKACCNKLYLNSV